MTQSFIQCELKRFDEFRNLDGQEYENAFHNRIREWIAASHKRLLERVGEELKLEKKQGSGNAEDQLTSFGFVMGYNHASDEVDSRLADIMKEVNEK